MYFVACQNNKNVFVADKMHNKNVFVAGKHNTIVICSM